GRRLFGQTTPAELKDKFAMSVRAPIGVVGIITPWNFPIAIATWNQSPPTSRGMPAFGNRRQKHRSWLMKWRKSLKKPDCLRALSMLCLALVQLLVMRWCIMTGYALFHLQVPMI